MRDFITEYMAYTADSEVPEIYSFWTGMALVSTALGGKCWAEIRGGRKIRPNLYIILVGESGSRKSVSVMRLGKELTFHHEELSRMLNFSANKFTKEAMTRNLAMNVKTEPGGYRHSSMAIFSSEMEVMMSDKSENRAFAMMLTELYDGTPFTYETKGAGKDVVPNPCMTLLAGATPSSIGKMMDEAIVEAGFTPRILFIMSKNEKVIPFESLDEAKVPKLLERLHRIALTTGAFKLTGDANDRYGELYRHMRSKAGIESRICDDPKLKNWYSRKQDLIVKVSTCLAASAGSDVVEVGHINKALEVIEEAEHGMVHALKGIGDNQSMDVIDGLRSFMRKCKQIKRGELVLKMMASFENKKVNEAIEILKGASEIAEDNHNGNANHATMIWTGK